VGLIADEAYNAGYALQAAGHYGDALRCYDDVLRAYPEHAQSAWGRAICLLAIGDFARGWPAYEVRYDPRLPNAVAHKPEVGIPMWQGEPLAGKRILLIGEQGAGDQIQFIRYASLLARDGAQVEFLTDARLQRLMEGVDGLAAVHASIALDSARFDYWSFLLSLPLRLGTTAEHLVPEQVPYLWATAEDIDRWERKLSVLPRGLPKVGLVWTSGAHVLMPHRNIALDTLRRLARVKGVSFVGLQFGENGSSGGFPSLQLGSELGDFADNAAAFALLDGLVTVDTAAAHLAGAMGIRSWILLSAVSDWRWMLARDDSPWYPSSKLVRQSTLGDWRPVVDQVAGELERLYSA
jgi:hypothetical protein